MGAGIGGLEADWTGILRRAIVAGRAGLTGPEAKLLVASFAIPVYDEMPQAAQALAALAWVETHGCPPARSI